MLTNAILIIALTFVGLYFVAKAVYYGFQEYHTEHSDHVDLWLSVMSAAMAVALFTAVGVIHGIQ